MYNAQAKGLSLGRFHAVKGGSSAPSPLLLSVVGNLASSVIVHVKHIAIFFTRSTCHVKKVAFSLHEYLFM